MNQVERPPYAALVKAPVLRRRAKSRATAEQRRPSAPVGDEWLNEAVEELRAFITRLRKARGEQHALMAQLEDEKERKRELLELGKGVLSPSEIKRITREIKDTEWRLKEVESHLLLFEALIHIFTAFETYLRVEVAPSKSKLETVKRVFSRFSTLPTIAKIILAVMSLSGVPVPPFSPFLTGLNTTA